LNKKKKILNTNYITAKLKSSYIHPKKKRKEKNKIFLLIIQEKETEAKIKWKKHTLEKNKQD
jgi:glycine cleavage system protein P-like pyridoxal-binding family